MEFWEVGLAAVPVLGKPEDQSGNQYSFVTKSLAESKMVQALF